MRNNCFRNPSWTVPSVARKLLLSLFGIGIIGLTIGGGTLANFQASTVNPTNSFAAGTLVMSNSGDATNCTAVAANTCQTLVGLTGNTGMSTSGAVATGNVTITNAGSLPATMQLTLANASGGLVGTSTLNMTVYDVNSGYCIYGHSSGSPTAPIHAACDTLTTSTPYQSADNFTNVGPLTIPPSGTTCGTKWCSNEAHQFNVTVQTVSGAAAGAQASIEFDWSGLQ